MQQCEWNVAVHTWRDPFKAASGDCNKDGVVEIGRHCFAWVCMTCAKDDRLKTLFKKFPKKDVPVAVAKAPLAAKAKVVIRKKPAAELPHL